jgi:alkanesulfonate monooxygenase SsuD/methylene tetrahydromethanopterin reductase-like flavin-dependent oxidoreductase (luciferase family)
LLGREFSSATIPVFSIMRKSFGPLFMIVGLFVLGWLRLPTGFSVGMADRFQRFAEQMGGVKGAFLFGIAFSLGFCPTMFLIFFGTLMPLTSQTKRIRLTSAVTVLSSADPVRVFQDFATVDAISNGRAEIMAGRGSFIESFPLFGYDLQDYDELFEEKLELLLKIRKSEKVTWEGKHRTAIHNLGVYPRPVQNPLPVWIGSGGNSDSVIRAGLLGLPLVLAIIGGSPMQFAPLVQLGRERGWGHYSRASFDAARRFEGALYVGDPETVAEKIIHLRKHVGITRFMLHVPVGSMPHPDVMSAIELLGTKVAPRVREEISKWEIEHAEEQ